MSVRVRVSLSVQKTSVQRKQRYRVLVSFWHTLYKEKNLQWGLLAQLVEQYTFNVWVLSSSLKQATKVA